VDTIVKGIELSWTTWGKMRGERLVLDDISYVKSEKEKGFERIFLVNIEKNQFADWLNIVNTAFFQCELVTLDQFNDVLKLDNTNFYLGLLNGKPVTTCMTTSEDDTSVLEMIATLKEYRRKGFASVVIDRALIDLRQLGIKTISLRAEADGVGVYKKLGFKDCFKRIVASCDWQNVYKKACPCQMDNEKIEKAKKY